MNPRPARVQGNCEQEEITGEARQLTSKSLVDVTYNSELEELAKLRSANLMFKWR